MSYDIRLVAFDLDGTVLPIMSTEISSSFVTAMEQAAAKGVAFAVFTGRSLTTIPSSALAHPAINYLSHSNGGGVVDKQTNEVLYSSPMPSQMAVDVLTVLEPITSIVTQVFSQGQVIYSQYALDNLALYELPPHHVESIRSGGAVGVPSLVEFARDAGNVVDKLNIAHVVGQQREQITRSLAHIPGLDIVSSGGANLEFNASTTNKGFALAALAGHLGLAPMQVMAIGDNDNDVGMLRWAGLGVALGSGSLAARQAADYVTLSLEDEGAADAIRRFIL